MIQKIVGSIPIFHPKIKKVSKNVTFLKILYIYINTREKSHIKLIMKTNTNIQLLSNQMFHLWATITSSANVFGFDYDVREPKNLKLKLG